LVRTISRFDDDSVPEWVLKDEIDRRPTVGLWSKANPKMFYKWPFRLLS